MQNAVVAFPTWSFRCVDMHISILVIFGAPIIVVVG